MHDDDDADARTPGTSRRARILSIGDELVAGEILDTNAAVIAAALAERGVRTTGHATLPDDRDAIAAALRDGARTDDLVVATGGLGPTADDLTRFALGDVVDPGAELVEDAEQAERLQRWFAARSERTRRTNLVQALRPAPASMLTNEHGTAAGLVARAGRAWIVCLPGPPQEMTPMLGRALDDLAPARDAPALARGIVRSCGLPESEAADRLGGLMDRARDPLVGTTASDGVVSARVRAVAAKGGDVERDLAEVERRWAPYAFGRGDVTVAEATGACLHEAKATVVTAESCTGGGLGAALTDVAGSSAWYDGGVVTYSNAMKERLLGVPAALLAEHGAVSAPVGRAMALGALERVGGDWSLATTGIAGPGGGTTDKPVGEVWIGIAMRTGNGSAPAVRARRFRFRGTREVVRRRTVQTALVMLRLALLKAGGPAAGAADPPLTWEVAP